MKLIFCVMSLLWTFNAHAASLESIVPRPFAEPPASYKLQQNYEFLDPQNLIRKPLLLKALKFHEFNFARFRNPDFISLIDFSIRAGLPRYFLLNMKTGEVKAMLTAVGSGSDPDGDGLANSFSNIADSHQSSLGFYLTDDEYVGSNGRSLRLHGLNSTNSNALKRAIVVHGAPYVSELDQHAGRSHGCPAVDLKNIDALIDQIKDGSLMFTAYQNI